MLLGRFIPVIAPMAMAASLAVKKPTPFTVGTMRTDTFTFALRAAGNDSPGRRTAVPAGRGPWPGRRAFWPDCRSEVSPVGWAELASTDPIHATRDCKLADYDKP